jgi:aspartate carbamoyltransferase catalytic subunit
MTEATTVPPPPSREEDVPKPRRHLLGISDLDRNDVERLLGTAATIARS